MDQRDVDAVRRLIAYMGEDPDREGLRDTPDRVLRAWADLTAGYNQNPQDILGRTFDEPGNGLVVLRDIPFASTCEHHLLPFVGTVSVGYTPNGRVVGLSKLARLVECFARRLQMQERMTREIAEALMEHLAPQGAGVVVWGDHSCMALRGIGKRAAFSTSCLLGTLRTDPDQQAMFFGQLGGTA